MRRLLCTSTLAVAVSFAPGSVPAGVPGSRAGAGRGALGSMSADPPPLAVMVNGLPGAMGREIAAAALRRGLGVAPFALTGRGMPGEVTVDDGSGGGETVVKLYSPDDCEALAAAAAAAYPTQGSVICIDFTHPTAVNGNAAWYAKHGLPFVMGTTGGDREELERTVREAELPCVIAPNMAKQIVALQAAIEGMARDFPGSFSDYTLSVSESHQSSKADTSGTAKAISAELARLTVEDFAEEQIEQVREPARQLEGGGPSHTGVSPVPETALSGHAFHTYSLLSADGKVEFQIRHNVQGRATYAEGTIDAASFLASRIADGKAAPMLSMVDVLRAGAM